MLHPNHSPLSWTLIRNFAEKFTWQDPSDGSTHEGFNPPPSAVNKQRKPFFIRFITRDGKTEAGRVVTLTVDGQKHQRTVKYVESGEIRIVRDYLIISIDEVYFKTHK